MKSNIYTSAQKVRLSLKPLVLTFLVIFINVQASAQVTPAGKTIRGIVKSSEDNEPVPGTNIYLKSASSVGTFSDANGQFEFPRQLKSGDVLVFSFLGLKTTEYVVSDQSAGLVAIMLEPDPIQMVDEILVEESETKSTVFARMLRKGKPNR